MEETTTIAQICGDVLIQCCGVSEDSICYVNDNSAAIMMSRNQLMQVCIINNRVYIVRNYYSNLCSIELNDPNMKDKIINIMEKFR